MLQNLRVQLIYLLKYLRIFSSFEFFEYLLFFLNSDLKFLLFACLIINKELYHLIRLKSLLEFLQANFYNLHKAIQGSSDLSRFRNSFLRNFSFPHNFRKIFSCINLFLLALFHLKNY